MVKRLPSLLILLAAVAPAADAGRSFDNFWKADNPKAAAKAADQLVAAHVEFDTAWTTLKAGRPYAAAPTGAQRIAVAADGQLFQNAIDVPADYDPARRWPVRVQLHGGINRAEPQEHRGPNRVAGNPEQIYVYPIGWADTPWWSRSQVDNILELLDTVKRRYNVDESHVALSGTSDGGTGAFFFAMRAPTPFCGFLPLIGHIKVLASPGVDPDGELFAANMANRPFFIVNDDHDPLYPAAAVAPYIALMKNTIGVPLVFHPEHGGHDVQWWPDERDAFEQFIRDHARDPHPTRLSWETERTDRYNRIDWLVIDELGATPYDSAPADVNDVELAPGAARSIFPRRHPSGRVDIVRSGNAFGAATRGVRSFTLLLSPDAVDFSRPITVTVNGRLAFQGGVARDPAVLLKWAARDNDRTMLYAAELKVPITRD